MKADELIQYLAIESYAGPLSSMRDEPAFPDPDQPLHTVILIIDAETEISMSGMPGLLGNCTGRQIEALAAVLDSLGASHHAQLFHNIIQIQRRHGGTWERLQADSAGLQEFQIISFRDLHGPGLEAMSEEIGAATPREYEMFNAPEPFEDLYALLEEHVANHLEEIIREIENRDVMLP